MRLFMKPLTGPMWEVQVQPPDKIRDVKNKNFTEKGIPTAVQRLAVRGTYLENDLSLQYYGISEDTIMQVALSPSGGMAITIKHAVGRSFNLNVDIKDTVAKLKKKITEEIGVPAKQQVLTCQGKRMCYNDTLGSCNIQQESVVEAAPPRGDGIKLLICQDDEETVYYASPTATTESLQTQVLEHEGFDPSFYELVFEGRKLTSGQRLNDYDIRAGSKLTLRKLPRGNMQVFVKTLTGKKVTLECDQHDTIESIKKQLAVTEAIPVREQRLTFMAQDLKKRRTLKQYNIPTKATLNLSLRLRGHQLKIYVVTREGQDNIRLLVDHSDTIGFLKSQIQEKTGLATTQQRLVCNNQEMRDHKSLKDYQIRYGSTDIYLGVRLHPVVTLLTGKSLTLDMDTDDTFRSVKAEIFNKEGVPISEQKLSFFGEVFHDDSTLEYSGIHDNANLQLGQ